MAASDRRPPMHHRESDDAFGRMLRDYHAGDLAETPVYRRDDGEVTEAHLAGYFAGPDEWHDVDSLADALTGHLFDVGCGAGRTALWAQKRGHEVTAMDRSPGAVAVAGDRGVERCFVMDLRDLPVASAAFDTVFVLGNQVGLGDSLSDLRRTLDGLARVTAPGGRLVADLDAPSRRDPDYREAHRLAEGAAYRRFRVEYDGLAGPWVDIVMAEFGVVESLVAETPWRVDRTYGLDSEGPGYRFVLERV